MTSPYGQREALERRGVGAAHDLDAGARRVREPGRVERVGPLQVGAQLLRDPLLPVRGAIAELRAKRRSRAGVDAERRRALGHAAAEGCRPISSSSFSASASFTAGGSGTGSRPQPAISGRAAADASAAMASRRVSMPIISARARRADLTEFRPVLVDIVDTPPVTLDQ